MKILMSNAMTITFVLFASYLIAQPKLDLSINSGGNERTIATLTNENNSNLNAITFQMRSGENADEALCNFTTFGETYTATSGFGGYSALTNFNNGFIIRSTDPGGYIRLITGGSNLGNTRLLVAGNGNVALGQAQPATKLHIQEGDIFLDGNSSSTSGIVMEAPNGSCYKVTIDNTGTLSTTALPSCPN